MRVKIDSDTKIYYEIGDPLAHTCSAYLHNSMYDLANINAISLNLTVKKGDLDPFCKSVRLFGIAGFDITMPHKSDIIPFLDECDPFSREFRCVNAVKNVNGKLIGTGLDGMGMILAIEAAGVELDGQTVLILGAGAVSGLVAAELCRKNVKKIILLNRTMEKAEHIERVLQAHFAAETCCGILSDENLHKYAPEAGLVLQCTSLGMAGTGADFEDLSFVEKLPTGAVAADVIYNPERTRFLQQAEECGHTVINGMGMLIHQQRAMMKFHFGVELGPDFYDTGEEAFMIAMSMREARKKRLQRQAKLK